MNESGRSMVDGALRLGAVALVAAGVLAAIYSATHERIAEQERRAQLRVLHEVVPRSLYDNELLNDMIRVQDAMLLGSETAQRIFRGRQDGKLSVVAMDVTAPGGYSGPIHLMIGVRSDGSITGVRVTRHRETPGLGDGIDIEVSDWITQFDQRSLGDPTLESWAVKKDDGVFDQFTGATITARAVVEAVRDALLFYRQNRQRIDDMDSQPPD